MFSCAIIRRKNYLAKELKSVAPQNDTLHLLLRDNLVFHHSLTENIGCGGQKPWSFNIGIWPLRPSCRRIAGSNIIEFSLTMFSKGHSQPKIRILYENWEIHKKSISNIRLFLTKSFLNVDWMIDCRFFHFSHKGFNANSAKKFPDQLKNSQKAYLGCPMLQKAIFLHWFDDDAVKYRLLTTTQFSENNSQDFWQHGPPYGL